MSPGSSSQRILHLALRSDWNAALQSGTYRVSTRTASLDEVGFIHASYPEQLPRVAEFAYVDAQDELCVLVIDTARVAAAGVRIALEGGGDGELFPHIYGAISPDWVVEVLPAGFGADGRFTF